MKCGCWRCQHDLPCFRRETEPESAWHVHCRVSGGVTGTREGLLQKDGIPVVYPNRGAADAAARELNRKMNGSFAIASFHYHAVPATAQATPGTLPPSQRCECEDAAHEDTEGIPFTARTAHRYGAVPGAHQIRTIHGTFLVCYACKDAGHMELLP
jgi:hypothetical protein